MYSRGTNDAATRNLRHHPRLLHYGAFGTQITDESLRILAGLPVLETLEFENCSGITDAGLRELERSPRLRSVKVRSCIHVAGEWTGSLRHEVESSSEPGGPGESDGYNFETFLDYPDLAVASDAPSPAGGPEGSFLSQSVYFGVHAEFAADGLRLSIKPGTDTRWVGMLTRQAFSVPVRIDMVIKPVGELHFLVRPPRSRFQ